LAALSKALYPDCISLDSNEAIESDCPVASKQIFFNHRSDFKKNPRVIQESRGFKNIKISI
jgi:hypothetical protein